MTNLETTTVFVYGTLRTNHSNWRNFLAPARGVTATTAPKYTMREWGGFPAVYANGETAITGEIFAADHETLTHLDRLENHPNWYKREEIEVTDSDGNTVTAWMYVMPQSKTQGEVIESGDWNDTIHTLYIGSDHRWRAWQ